MKHLILSFKEHVGERGCHFYDDEQCTFLGWVKVFHFLENMPKKKTESTFSEKLADTLANYNPDYEFLAVQQAGTQISVELYTQAR